MAPYDLLWPISKRVEADMPNIVVEEVGGTRKNSSCGMYAFLFLRFVNLKLIKHSVSSPKSPSSTDDRLESLRRYAESLVATLRKPRVDDSKDDNTSADETSVGNGEYQASGGRQESWKDREPADDGGLTGCREAVELLTRNQRKGEPT